MSLLPAFKIAAGFATPVLVAMAGVLLCRKHLHVGLTLVLSALLILIGIAGPMLAPEGLSPSTLTLISMMCHTGWFITGIAVVLLGLSHRNHDPRHNRIGR